MDRRTFLKIVGGASGAAAAGSCGMDKGTEYLIPYLVPPDEEIIPGEAIYYNTTCTECPAGCGVTVKVMEGSPVKLEGLEGHPINDGALCVRGQASITRLYHPERITGPVARNSEGKLRSVSWEEAGERIVRELEKAERGGIGSHYLSSQRTGISSGVIDLFCRSMNVTRHLDFEFFSHSAIREANWHAFARDEVPTYRIDDSDLLVTIGADILETFVSPVSHAVQLGRARARGDFNWIHFEPHLSLTGLQADDRLVIAPGSETYLLLYLLRGLLSREDYRRRIPPAVFQHLQRLPAGEAPARTGLSREGLDGIASRLERARRPLVIVGGVSTGHSRGLEAAFLCGLLQWITGATDSTVRFSQMDEASRIGSMLELSRTVEAIREQGAGVLFIADADPVALYSDPDGLREALRKVKLKVALSGFLNATAKECDIVLPLNHSLESWGDAEPRQGVHSIVQPVIEPLHDTMTEGDILLGLMRASSQIKRRRTFQSYLLERLGGPRPKEYVENLIRRGYAGEPKYADDIAMEERTAASFLRGLGLDSEMKRPVLVVTPSIRGFDGRSAALPLLREIPDPVTTITYGRWLSISESEAGRLGLEDGDQIAATGQRLSLSLPLKVLRGLPEGVYCVQRDLLDEWTAPFHPATGEPYCYAESFAISKSGLSSKLPVMSGSMSQHGRGIIPKPNHREHGGHGGDEASMYPEVEHQVHRWAMAVDLDLCVGCSACVAACYIENNVPVVGPEEHLKGREMSWLRVEPFYEEDQARQGPAGAPEGVYGPFGGRVAFVPMLCQHCTHAPCESVCPVYAAYHNPEGLNAQIYNRCVGTRYCSNNCPYKVRRFNWFTHKRPAPQDRMLNPDVFVRGKGVMEKCTFCVHRIHAARNAAKDESRVIRDGEVVPACAQTCPTGAIVLGDLMDESSVVYRLAHSERAFRIFETLGTEPAVYYLRRRRPGEEI